MESPAATEPRPFPYWESVVGVFALLISILASPSLLPKLQGSAAEFRGLLEQGLVIVRLAALGVVGLAYVSYRVRNWYQRQAESSPCIQATPTDRWALILILSLGSLLALPRLGTSLWWDELGTITRIVDRGPVVIFAFSCQANNHLLNSCLCWVARHLSPNLEIGVHLLPYIFFLLTIYTVFWMMRTVANFRAAVIATIALAIHPTVVTHAVEARGYAGAILFCTLATAVSCGLVARNWCRNSLAYVIASITAVGFILTTIFVPFAHGLWAIVQWSIQRDRSNATSSLISRPFDLMLAALWTAALSLLMCGLMLPQIANYSATAAQNDHLLLGLPLLTQCLFYLTGFRTVLVSLSLLALSAFGWFVASTKQQSRTARDFALASLLPLFVVAAYLLFPGTHSSPRFFCFLIVPICCGIGFGLDWLFHRPRMIQTIVGIVVALLTLQLAEIHANLLTINRPNLKQLASELKDSKVFLVGPQADANPLYFPDATWFHSVDEMIETWDESQKPDLVIEGRISEDNRLDAPNPVLDQLGYRIERALPSAVSNETEFIVYRRQDNR